MRNLITPDIEEVNLYVPSAGCIPFVAPQSIIIGLPKGDRIDAAMEGGIYGPMSLLDKLISACWRLGKRSSSAAYFMPKPEDVVQVGKVVWDHVLQTWIISEISDETALETWLGELPQIGGYPEQIDRAVGLIVSRDPQAMLTYQMASAQQRDPLAAVIAYARARGI